jgi:hypothetical protein
MKYILSMEDSVVHLLLFLALHADASA